MSDPRRFVPTLDASQGSQGTLGNNQYQSSVPTVDVIQGNEGTPDQIVKQDSNARHLRGKSWPLWDDWKLIFGKDMATRGTSEGVGQAIKDSTPGIPLLT
ncbi:hypothetical protein AAHA92_33374 [Salvia divinorum]|uniref:Uncharacterized protein n=1 Tax=Salvia divinorum TaxID=28513 RepID=A0ABD1FPQ4_SALDI